MSYTQLNELIAEAERIRLEYEAVKQRLEGAEQAVLVERFKDDEKFAEGDVVLVPRMLFGKLTMWPARIDQVHLNYNDGIYGYGPDKGLRWQSKSISYMVCLKAKDGTFSGATQGVYHADVMPCVAEEVA